MLQPDAWLRRTMRGVYRCSGGSTPATFIERLAGTNVVLVEKVSANVSLMNRIAQAPAQYREHASGVSKK